MDKFENIDQYIAASSEAARPILEKLRRLVHQEAPEATEAIAYGIPTLRLNGNLVHFAAFKNHIGFYPAPTCILSFKKDLAPYIKGKGTLQFPLDHPIPYDLVRRVVRFRVAENARRASQSNASEI